jgi:drug/metabolite transporter (DMT)-like permease
LPPRWHSRRSIPSPFWPCGSASEPAFSSFSSSGKNPVFLGVFCSGLAYFFWYSALEKKDSSLIGAYLYLEPFVTLIGAAILLNEPVKGITLFGGAMTLFGVYLVSWKGRKKS